MVELKRSENSLIENFVAWPNGLGYVLDYSDRTFAEFFEDEFRVDLYGGEYGDRGGSKRHHLISFCLKSPAAIVTRVLQALLEEHARLRDEGRFDTANAPGTGAFETLVASIVLSWLAPNLPTRRNTFRKTLSRGREYRRVIPSSLRRAIYIMAILQA